MFGKRFYGVGLSGLLLASTSCGEFSASPTPASNTAQSSDNYLQPRVDYKSISFPTSLPFPYAGLTLTKSGQLLGTTLGRNCSGCQYYGGIFRLGAGAIQPVYKFPPAARHGV